MSSFVNTQTNRLFRTAGFSLAETDLDPSDLTTLLILDFPFVGLS